MNKSIRFILLSALAILFGIICKEDDAVFFQKAAPGSCITEAVTQTGSHVLTSYKKENKDRIKNAIRIKARHDRALINISQVSDFVSVCLYSREVIYGGYRFNELSVHFSTSRLRGPPLA